MDIRRLYKCKDFEIKAYWTGNRLANSAEWLYTVIYHAPDGRSKDLNCGFGTKREAQKYISATVKKANAVLKKAHEEGKIQLKSFR